MVFHVLIFQSFLPELQHPPTREFLAMYFLHCPMLSSLAMMEKVERSGERNMAKIFFMNIMNIVLLMDLQLQPPPSREFLAMHFLHSPQLSSLAMGCIHCWGGRWLASA